METGIKTRIVRDSVNKKLKITREFDAPLEQVWKSWTDHTLLDQWWAPKPWKAKTKSMDFREGGTWLYAMVGPDGTEHWCRADYISIVPMKSFSAVDAFCDPSGKINEEFPRMTWQCEFRSNDSGTSLQIEILFATQEAIEKIIEMGFEEGFTAALVNLDEMLAK